MPQVAVMPAGTAGELSARCLVRGGPYFGRPLAVESLSELCSVLENAADGRRDLVIALDTDSTR